MKQESKTTNMENAPSITSDRLTPIPTVFREDVEQDVGLTVQTQLAKAGITEETLAVALDNAQAVMRPVENEADLRALQDVLTPIVRLRTSIVRICKKGREHANMVSKAWIAAEKFHVAQVATVEDKLTAYKDEWNAAKERAKAEEEAEAKRIIQDRYAALEAIGMVRRMATPDAPERYVIGMFASPLDMIDTADAATWDAIVEKATGIAAAQRAIDDEKRAREEAEAKARKEEAERIEAQRREQERKEAELKAREDALNAQTNEARMNELLAVGRDAVDAMVVPTLHNLSAEEFAELKESVRQTAEAMRRRAEQEAQEAREREEREAKERAEREARIAAEAAQRERERIAAEEQRKAEQEAERVRQLGDVGAIEKVCSDLYAIEQYCDTTQLQSTLAERGMEKVKQHINSAIAELNEMAKRIAA